MAKNEDALYERASASVPATVAKGLLDAAALKPDSMYAQRLDRTCDDNAGEFTYGILHARLGPVPLYEVRFIHGSQLMRLFSFAFVDGGFRFIIAPKLDGPVFPPTSSRPPSNHDVSAPPQTAEAEKRVTMGEPSRRPASFKEFSPTAPKLPRENTCKAPSNCTL
jgi:hypothetical protein